MIGPRSFRRLMPAVGWLGPLAFGRPAHAFAAQVEAILAADDDDWPSASARSRCPTLVIVGNQDILTPRGDSEELAERIPTAELVVISGAAHGLMIEHATTFNRGAARLPRPGGAERTAVSAATRRRSTRSSRRPRAPASGAATGRGRSSRAARLSEAKPADPASASERSGDGARGRSLESTAERSEAATRSARDGGDLAAQGKIDSSGRSAPVAHTGCGRSARRSAPPNR